MSTYRIWFDDPQGNRRSLYSNRMDAREMGLYLNEEWEEAFEWVHWIPPSRLVLITKIPESEGESL